MAELKTKRTEASVKAFIDSVQDEQKRKDAYAILGMMKRATKLKPAMWGPSIIGFGSVHYKYESGRQGDMCLMGFSPRKQNISLYLPGGQSAYPNELKRLGKYKTGVACLYIKRLADIDATVLLKILDKGAKSSKSG